MSGQIEWEAIPEKEYQAYIRRLEIVELGHKEKATGAVL
jgi:hypothetical protein